MINNILGFGMPGGFEFIMVAFMGLVFFVLPICLFVWIIKSMLKANRERQKTRMEVSKVADELEKIRKQGD
jgi:uncharacterized membrane protein